MHGRVKVKTTSQIEAENLAKKEKKLHHFKSIVNEIFRIRARITDLHSEESAENCELQNEIQQDQNRILQLTAEVLMSSPDISTFWNIRREILLALKEKSEESIEKYWKAELDLTFSCLPANPKSYGTWHHRCWTMLEIPDPNWEKDIELCTRYLKEDERNFHCWDYRRFAVDHATTSMNRSETELIFTNDKVYDNFSNYSAWHYRSKLLPLTHPSESSVIGISEQKRREELQLVENAMYTDAGDSSSWFYYRWLLNSCSSTHSTAQPSIQIIKKLQNNKLLVATSTWINANDQSALQLVESDKQLTQTLDMHWDSAMGHKFDTLWTTNCEVPTKCKLILNGCEYVVPDNDEMISIPFSGSNTEHDSKTLEILKQEHDSLQELIDSNEFAVGSQAASAEEKKWTKLNLALIIKTIKPGPQCEEVIVGMFSELENVDPKRKGYYADQKSRFIIENQLISGAWNSSLVNLSHKGLSSIYHPQFFCLVQELDLTSNKITSVEGLLPYLIECKKLILDDNLIEELDYIDSFDENDQTRRIGRNLQMLSLKRNPIVANDAVTNKVKTSVLKDIIQL